VQALSGETFFGRLLAKLAAAVCARPRLFIWPQLLLFFVCVFFTIDRLQFSTNRNDLVGGNQKYHENFLKLREEFTQQDDLVAVIESDDAEKSRQFVERLGAKLEAATIRIPAHPETNQLVGGSRILGWFRDAIHSDSQRTETLETNLFVNVFYKGDLPKMGSKALLFAEEGDLRELKKTLGEYRPFIHQFTQATNLVRLFELVNTQIRTASREDNAENRSLVGALPALERIVSQATASLQRPGRAPSPGLNALFNAGPEADQAIYLTFGRNGLFVVNAHALTDELNGDAVERMRSLIEETRAEVPGVNVGFTGEPVLELDEMLQSQKDTTVASVVSLIICALIFIYGYHETGRPLKATFCLVIGLGYTMAFATATIGHLNILTITFVPMLVGLAIDFGVHLVTRYEEELRHGKTEAQALEKAMVFTGKGIFTGAMTTAAGFLAMSFTGFKGIQEMGVICGGGLLICLVPMMTLLPALLLRGRQNVLDHQIHQTDHRARIEQLWLNRPWTTMGVSVALCVVAAILSSRVFFDYNLLHMQSRGLPAVQTVDKLRSSDKSIIFGQIVATNLEQAAAWEGALTNLPSIASVDSITRFLRQNPTTKLALIREIKGDVASLNFIAPDTNAVNIAELSRTLYSLHGYMGAVLDEVRTNDPALAKTVMSLRTAIDSLRKEMLAGDARALSFKASQLAAYQQALFSDIRDTFNALRTQDADDRLRAEDLPAFLRDRFIGHHGMIMLQVNPKADIWDREHQRVFIEDMRKVDPNATGTPVQLYQYTTLLKESYEEAAWYSLAAISLMVLLHFRSPLAVVLALLPVGIGSLWLVGWMGATGIPFNPANIMTLPLVIGIGVTNGIHILNRFAEEQNPGILAKSTGKAVLVSGLTTIAGFGSLIPAAHQGIQSLGLVMAIGTAVCMFAGLTFLPALLIVLMRKFKVVKNQPSGATE
jgi:hopanoid biosynthesis associated RND transporter like protein HpnN